MIFGMFRVGRLAARAGGGQSGPPPRYGPLGWTVAALLLLVVPAVMWPLATGIFWGGMFVIALAFGTVRHETERDRALKDLMKRYEIGDK